MELVDPKGAGGHNLAIELNVRFFLFSRQFFKDCGLLARLSRRAVLLTPHNFFFLASFNSGDLFWVMVFNPAELGLTFESPGDCVSG